MYKWSDEIGSGWSVTEETFCGPVGSTTDEGLVDREALPTTVVKHCAGEWLG